MKLKDKVFEIVKNIPKGKVTTYKAIGDALGTKGYRAIGQILKYNPDAPRVPCHRVVGSDGKMHGYLGNLIDQKIKLLQSEGVEIKNGKVVNFKKAFHRG